MSTEHAIGVSVWLPCAVSVMRAVSGSLRYCSLNGFCTDRRSIISYLLSRNRVIHSIVTDATPGRTSNVIAAVAYRSLRVAVEQIKSEEAKSLPEWKGLDRSSSYL